MELIKDTNMDRAHTQIWIQVHRDTNMEKRTEARIQIRIGHTQIWDEANIRIWIVHTYKYGMKQRYKYG